MFRLGCLLVASLAIASAQSKVAVVNIQNAILDTQEIKKAQAELEAKYKPRQQQLTKLQSDLADLQNRLQGGKLSPQQTEEAQATGARKQREAQRLQEDLQAEVNNDRNDILQRTGSRMSEVVKKLAEEKGVDLVVDGSSTLYVKPALDLTKDATAAYDKTYPAK